MWGAKIMKGVEINYFFLSHFFKVGLAEYQATYLALLWIYINPLKPSLAIIFRLSKTFVKREGILLMHFF
jgi:hypothetical protein